MDDQSQQPTRGLRPAEAGVTTRSRLAAWLDTLTDEAYAEALYQWARGDDGPMPTREDARADAEDQARLLLSGLGEWGALSPELLEVQQLEAGRAGYRQRQRNARPRSPRPDPFLDWWDLP